ncbi:TetR family transcriptional regulator [Roseobacter cerasinus]|uniref:TetR family transcriptional regulator n=1 Tax=Roseobacter cerasinus TaxID=2602289 RepID=A0A640VIK4_9RHOB|nr:TetR/AcrR family transcriptional regulator [Roseobacter cerasinus]GFE48368.1 TetR family transcriptional regulator [Roseobacter cerasinus]
MTVDTKTALLDFAEHAARARGFDGFSYADLAEAVGIRKASIHYHFPTKAILSAALMDRYHSTIEELCQAIAAEHDTAGGRILGLINLYRDALGGGKTLCLCVSLTASRESLSDDVTGKINDFRVMMIKWITAVFELGQNDQSIAGVTQPEHEARSTLALLEGAHLAARAEEDTAVFDRAVEVLKARCT